MSTLPTEDQHAIEEEFEEFKPLFQHQEAQIIQNAPKKSRLLDPLPTSVLVKVLDVLLPLIAKMVNLSLHSGIFAFDWKLALVLP